MNNNIQSLPSIAELANRNKETTSQICLRIKDSTKEFFEEQAKLYSSNAENQPKSENSPSTSETTTKDDSKSKISANSLMTSLLDAYVEKCTQQATLNQQIVTRLRAYLHKQAQLVSQADDDRLLYRVFKEGFKNGEANPDFQFALQDYKSLNELCARYHYQKDGNWDHGEYICSQIYYELYDELGGEIHCVKPGGPSAEYVPSDESPYEFYNIITVSIDKWIVVVAMVDAYVRKARHLFNDEQIGLSFDAYMELVNLINQTDERRELAFKLADFLADYAEQIYG